MKRLTLLAMVLASQVHGGAVISLLRPSLTTTPIVPSMLTSGQAITARFGVDSPGQFGWAVALGTTVVADAAPSGQWLWVIDEDGSYGIDKFVMASSCPNPGQIVVLPTPVVHPIIAPFVVPDYGPQTVTMVLHALARTVSLGGCAFDSHFVKVVVIVPGPTWTPTKTQTPAPGSTLTRTPTRTPTSVPPTPTSVTTTVPTAAPTISSARPVIEQAWAVPNPNPTMFVAKVQGVPDSIRIDVYTSGWTLISTQTYWGPWTAYNHILWSWPTGVANGTYIAKLTCIKAGAETNHKMAYAYLMR